MAGAYAKIADDKQLFTGFFAAPLLHDVWVAKVDGRWQAVLSYWDAGFVILDVDDPHNPFVLGDSTYPEPDPIRATANWRQRRCGLVKRPRGGPVHLRGRFQLLGRA